MHEVKDLQLEKRAEEEYRQIKNIEWRVDSGEEVYSEKAE
jgi:hypothetical protein